MRQDRALITEDNLRILTDPRYHWLLANPSCVLSSAYADRNPQHIFDRFAEFALEPNCDELVHAYIAPGGELSLRRIEQHVSYGLVMMEISMFGGVNVFRARRAQQAAADDSDDDEDFGHGNRARL